MKWEQFYLQGNENGGVSTYSKFTVIHIRKFRNRDRINKLCFLRRMDTMTLHIIKSHANYFYLTCKPGFKLTWSSIDCSLFKFLEMSDCKIDEKKSIKYGIDLIFEERIALETINADYFWVVSSRYRYKLKNKVLQK